MGGLLFVDPRFFDLSSPSSQLNHRSYGSFASNLPVPGGRPVTSAALWSDILIDLCGVRVSKVDVSPSRCPRKHREPESKDESEISAGNVVFSRLPGTIRQSFTYQ
jgi:hypothetical protein